MTQCSIPPFGQCPLTRRELWAREQGVLLNSSSWHKIWRSFLWRFAHGTQRRARDVTLFEDQQVRLHPYDNICEKRVFLTPQLWEPEERAYLSDFIRVHDKSDFVFVDAGANVGLYTLFARHCALQSDKTFQAFAIEPGQTVRERLMVNLELSGAIDEVMVADFALSGDGATMMFTPGQGNLGESRVIDPDNRTPLPEQKMVDTRPLLSAVKGYALKRIDALKIDIEGFEYPVLRRFFEDAPSSFWPRLVIMEIAHAPDSDKLLSLFEKRDYHSVSRNRGNIVLQRTL